MDEISHGKTRASVYADDVPVAMYHRSRIGLGLRLVQRHFPNLRGIRAFDFGCGEGFVMRWLAARGAVAEGCDPTRTLIDRAIDRGTRNAILGSSETMQELPGQAYDLVIALHVLSFCTPDQIARFWVEAARIVKPGGYMVVTTPNVLTEQHIASGYDNPTQLLALEMQHGFSEVDRDYIGYYPVIFRWPLLYKLTKWGTVGRWLGLRPRGGRVYHPWRLALVPRSWLAARCTGYYSMAKRV